MKAVLQLVLGFVVAVGLMVLAVMLWARTLMIFAAPVGFLSLGAAWVAIDNQFVYRRRRDGTRYAAPADPPEERP
jgi:hypothetical protein